MDRAERLASYLAGDLPADERAALEAELAGDPELRTELAAIQRADEALADLPAVEPPSGFEARLRARLDPVVAEQVGAPTERDARSPADELAARRRRWRRVPALAAAAAGVLALVVGGVVITDLLPADDEAPFTTADDALEAEPEVEDLEAAESLDAGPPGPVIVDDDRELDDAVITEVLAGADLDAIATRGFDTQPGSELAQRFQAELGASTPPAPDEAPEAAPEDAPDEPDDDGRALTTRDGEQLAPQTAGEVARCLEELLEPGVAAIPAYVELGQADGVEALLFGLVTVDPETAAFTRTEAWVVERATCQPLRFEQG